MKNQVLLVAVAALLTACLGGGGSSVAPAPTGPSETPVGISAGPDQTASERNTVLLQATVNNSQADQLTPTAYAWFPADESVVFFGEAGRSSEPEFNLTLPQVAQTTTVEYVLQVQFSNQQVLEDRLSIQIVDDFPNPLPNVLVSAQPVGRDGRLQASACESTDDTRITEFAWRNETTRENYPATTCQLDVVLPSSPMAQTFTLRAIAVDDQAGLGFRLFEVTTPGRDSNTQPVIESARALPEPVRPGEQLALAVQATDADGDTLFYEWTQTSGGTVELMGANQANAQARIPDGFADQTLQFQVRVSDVFPLPEDAPAQAVLAQVRQGGPQPVSLMDCLTNPTAFGCPLAGLGTAPPLGFQQPNSTQFSAGQCTPFFGGGLDGNGYRHLTGAMHEHTAYSDGAANTDPAMVYRQVRERGFDFVMSSDHSDNLAIPLALPDTNNCFDEPLSCLISDPNNLGNSLTKWQSTLRQAREITTESAGGFTAMRGFEWTSDRFGHANVYMSSNNINAKAGPGYAVSMDLFWQWFVFPASLGGGDDGLLIFNHPGREDQVHNVLLQIGEGLSGVTRMAGALNELNLIRQGDPAYAFNDFRYVAPADYRVVGVEVFGKGTEYDTDGRFGSWYAHALDKGWYLGPAGSEDHHEKDWGAANLPKTIVIARSNSQTDIREALLARRFYTVAQNENALRLSFDALDGAGLQPMGTRLGTRDTRQTLRYSVSSTDAADALENLTVQLFSSQASPTATGEPVYTPLLVGQGTQGEFDVPVPEGKSWYFLRVLRGDRIVAVSAPIWLFGNQDALPECR